MPAPLVVTALGYRYLEVQGGTGGQNETAALSVIPLQAQNAGIDINRAGIIKGDAGANVGDCVTLLVVNTVIVKGTGRDHLVIKGLALVKVPVLLKVPH